ncbi:putative Tudor domain-containing protein [Plasmopara halstedii]
MVELSFLVRLVLTLLLLALSVFAYNWLSAPSVPSPPLSVKRSKKRSKKKAAKQSTSQSPSNLSPEKPQTSVASTELPLSLSTAGGEDHDDSDTDSDNGLSVAQVLATRKFKPKNLGGKIQTSLPPANVPKFAVNQKVIARFQGGPHWYPATVSEQRKGNEYHLKYDDGEVEYRVPAEYIKLRPTKADESIKDIDDTSTVVESKTIEGKVELHEASSSSNLSESDDDDGWQVVGTSAAAKRQRRLMGSATPAEPLIDGLTKRQRENRRKTERQREKKDLLRQHAQKDDLDARARWRYVPS